MIFSFFMGVGTALNVVAVVADGGPLWWINAIAAVGCFLAFVLAASEEGS